MDTNLYRKVEGMLYGHYRRKKRIDTLKSRLIRIENRIKRLRDDIKECNVELSDTLKAIDYSREYIQSGDVTSNIEKELEIVIDKMLKEIEINIKEKYKLKNKIMHLEKQTENIENLLQEFNEEELKIIELRYKEGLSYRQMEAKLFMARTSINNKKNKIILHLIEEIDQ
ncbi:hypothetical protein KQI42_20130 [Tissierella sp. MSJ-40]|uniref:Sigma-70 family RNA polymerase sigma factor n=1 Tax=Tissierella simiarum TaxID=2841534 RepID=A0ABS6EC02_9FIRM|nr:hypothetical protein [Tissierella simiarum]MBU5440307.1 hypothetical protein [Tissierella simiarum]